MKTEDRKKLGKKTRKAGKDWENWIREDLTSKGWIVIRFDKNVEPKEGIIGRLVQVKAKWNNFTKSLMMGSGGFPDYICFKIKDTIVGDEQPREWFVQLVECKISGKLDRLEKDKANWIIKNLHIPVIIAEKIKVKRKIEAEYEEFKET
jgi:hypothetical protein